MAEKKIDISSLVLNANKKEREDIKSLLESMDIDEINELVTKPKKIVQIENYKDPRVEMYSPKSVYKVINATTRTSFFYNGMQLASLLIGSKSEYDKVKSKTIPPNLNINGMHITFKYFEAEE